MVEYGYKYTTVFSSLFICISIDIFVFTYFLKVKKKLDIPKTLSGTSFGSSIIPILDRTFIPVIDLLITFPSS